MAIVYKLTDGQCCTFGDTHWGPGIRHEATGEGRALCTDGWIHYYRDPVLAVLCNPGDARFAAPRLWEAKTHGKTKGAPLKGGAKGLTVVRELPLPVVTLEVPVTWGILCAMSVFSEVAWTTWANGWLDGSDRSARAAWVAVAAVRARPAWSVPKAAWSAVAAEAAAAAAAEVAAEVAAEAAARAAWAAAEADRDIDFVALAHKAVRPAGRTSNEDHK